MVQSCGVTGNDQRYGLWLGWSPRKLRESMTDTDTTGRATPDRHAEDVGRIPGRRYSAANGRADVNRSTLLAAGLFLAVTIAAFETTAVITALPTIVDELNGRSLYGLTLSINMLANLIAIVGAGEAADRRGPAFPFGVCAVLFIAGLLVAGTAPVMPVVVLGRFLQGGGIGGFGALAYVGVRRGFDEDQQPRMYAILSAGWVLPSLVAPLIAGTVTDRFGWRWVFLGLVLPAALVSTVVVRQLQHLPHEAPAERSPSRMNQAVILSAGAGGVLGGLTLVPTAPWLGLLLAVPSGTIAWNALQRLLPPGWHRALPGVPAAVVCRLLAAFAFLGVDSFVPLAADRIHRVGATTQGMVIIGASITWTIGQAAAARTHGRIRPATLIGAGFALMVLGIAAVAPVVRDETPLWLTFLAWSIGGLGMGLLFNPTTVFAMSTSDERDAGRVSGWLNIADSLGFATIGGIGGAVIAASERNAFSLRGALLTCFALAASAAAAGIVASRRVR